MSNAEACPICGYALDENAVTVTVGGGRRRVCCDDCAKEAVANPAKLATPPASASGR